MKMLMYYQVKCMVQPFFLLNDKQICLREGHEGMKLLGPYKGYNMETDATASNEVGAAAFR